MGRRALTLCLLLVPAVGARRARPRRSSRRRPARPGAAGVGAPAHFAVRQLVGLGCGAAARRRAGAPRDAAPLRAPRRSSFSPRWPLTLAVFAPGIGVRAAGARRWLHLGPLSGGPAPFLIGAVALLVAAARDARRARRLAAAGALLAVLALVAEPDFSAAAIALAVAFAALAGGGVRRAAPAAGGGPPAHRAGDRRHALRLRREPDPRLSCRPRAIAAARGSRCWRSRTPTPAGAAARRRPRARQRPPPAVVARQRLRLRASSARSWGAAGPFGVVAAWLAIGAGVVLAARSPAPAAIRPRARLWPALGTALRRARRAAHRRLPRAGSRSSA